MRFRQTKMFGFCSAAAIAQFFGTAVVSRSRQAAASNNGHFAEQHANNRATGA
jgi:hypothetical protein